ncbi:SGNH/GDSL hydrolase family protein [Providencia vermicola]|uniref:SGNH/GDSL hydrolase family protein n=1 Tax=Providencia vermicola TaxID=333965 RepID=UPI0032DB0BD4
MKFIILLFTLIYSIMGHSKPLFIGDSLTYQIASSYKEYQPVDALYLEGSGLHSNKNLDWQSYVKTLPIGNYETIYIVLGTNDLIEENEIITYKTKVKIFIQSIKSKNTSIIWLLPPELKDRYKNNLLKNTRHAIQSVGSEENIKLLDMRNSLGMRYTQYINNVPIRTKDGIHITKQGGDRITKLILSNN